MADLRTDFKDDIYSGNRKYIQTTNEDGTVSFSDSTTYEQRGDAFGANELNAITKEVNRKADKTDIPESLPADGGDADTVNGHTVESDVPANANFVSDSQIANWNGKANGSHTHPASQVTAGALPIGVTATNGTDYGTSRVRNIYAGTADLTPGVSALASGSIYIVYE